MSMERLVSVTAIIKAQNTKGRFTVPDEIRKFLGLDDEDQFSMLIENDNGSLMLNEHLKSGPEMYGGQLPDFIPAGSLFRLTVFK